MKKRSHTQKLMERRGLEDRDDLNGSNEDILHRVAATAYELYQQRGREDGYDVEDWLKAEAFVKSQAAH